VLNTDDQPSAPLRRAQWTDHARKALVLDVADLYDPSEEELRPLLIPKVHRETGRLIPGSLAQPGDNPQFCAGRLVAWRATSFQP
jgi:hypothetical protein